MNFSGKGLHLHHLSKGILYTVLHTNLLLTVNLFR